MGRTLGTDFSLIRDRLRTAYDYSVMNGHQVKKFRSPDFIIYSAECELCGGAVEVDLSIHTPEEDAYPEALSQDCEGNLEALANKLTGDIA